MGIIQNGGIRAPTLRIEHLSFAKGTPFATVFEPANTQGERVMPAEVANALRNALSKVVEGGRRGASPGPSPCRMVLSWPWGQDGDRGQPDRDGGSLRQCDQFTGSQPDCDVRLLHRG